MGRKRRLFLDGGGMGILGGGRPAFLLQDDFTDTRAAGSVNGTLATPGGTGTAAQRTRTVVDSANHLSIGGGNCVIDGGTGVQGDPGQWHGGFTRTAGRMMIWRELAWVGANQVVGWDGGQSGGLNQAVYQPSANVIHWNITTLLVHAVVKSYPIYYAIVMRANGSYLFFKNAGAAWKMLWPSLDNTTTPMYPGISGHTAAFNIPFMRIPAALFLPNVLAYDTFTRANAAIGTSEAAGPESQLVNARTWTGTTATIATNKAVITPTLGAELASGTLTVGTWYSITATEVNHFYAGSAIGDTFRATANTALDANNKVKAITLATMFASVDVGSANFLAGAELVATTRLQTGLIVNLDSATSPDDFIIAYIDQNVGAGTTIIKLDECVNGTYTNKVNVTNATYAANARLVIIRDGTACRVMYNNLPVGTVQTMTANVNTRVGLFSTDATNTFNDFLVMPRGNEGQFAGLNNFIQGG